MVGWNPEEFHGQRLLMDYPLYGSQVCVVHPLG